MNRRSRRTVQRAWMDEFRGAPHDDGDDGEDGEDGQDERTGWRGPVLTAWRGPTDSDPKKAVDTSRGIP